MKERTLLNCIYPTAQNLCVYTRDLFINEPLGVKKKVTANTWKKWQVTSAPTPWDIVLRLGLFIASRDKSGELIFLGILQGILDVYGDNLFF